jgi:hypothetical protein
MAVVGEVVSGRSPSHMSGADRQHCVRHLSDTSCATCGSCPRHSETCIRTQATQSPHLSQARATMLDGDPRNTRDSGDGPDALGRLKVTNKSVTSVVLLSGQHDELRPPPAPLAPKGPSNSLLMTMTLSRTSLISSEIEGAPHGNGEKGWKRQCRHLASEELRRTQADLCADRRTLEPHYGDTL